MTCKENAPVRGQDDFHGAFDFFEWSAPYYFTPREVVAALDASGAAGKQIKGIYLIGCVRHYHHLFETLQAAGIELGEGGLFAYPRLDEVLIPREVRACEPIQFVFADDSTLELLPLEGGGARIGVNTIPAGLTEGLSHPTLDANRFFAEAIGRRLKRFSLHVRETVSYSLDRFSLDREPYRETQHEYRLCLDCSWPVEMALSWSWKSGYTVSLRDDDGKDRIPYRRLKEATRETLQVPIFSGNERGGTIWIAPRCGDKARDDRIFFTNNYGISIDDWNVRDYLAPFLHKYFDPGIQGRGPCEEPGFDWYGGNRYTFASMRKLLAEIAAVIPLLEQDYDAPALAKLRQHLPWRPYDFDFSRQYTEEEKEALKRKGVPVAVDFYRRFIRRLEAMLRLEGFDQILFVGP